MKKRNNLLGIFFALLFVGVVILAAYWVNQKPAAESWVSGVQAVFTAVGLIGSFGFSVHFFARS